MPNVALSGDDMYICISHLFNLNHIPSNCSVSSANVYMNTENIYCTLCNITRTSLIGYICIR